MSLDKIKYPRSYHLHYSEKLSSKDDRSHIDDAHFIDKNVTCSIKMDGENTTCSNEYSHARSLNSGIDSEDRRWVESMRTSKIVGNIPDSYRICGENLFYKHTCAYDNLDSLFNVFSIWDNKKCLSWKETVKISNELELSTVHIFYEGIYDKGLILEAFNNFLESTTDDVEGFVVRNSGEFMYEDFKFNLSKFVRNTFVVPPQHWRHSKKTINKLSNNKNPWEI